MARFFLAGPATMMHKTESRDGAPSEDGCQQSMGRKLTPELSVRLDIA